MRTSLTTGAALAALATALSGCPAPQQQLPPELPPVITSFKADKTQVQAGTAVKLSFTADRAKEVTLLDQTGAAIDLSGDASAGEATVNPTETSFYVLRASGTGGRDSAFVQVAVNEGLKSVFLIAVPTEVNAGETVTVAWSALGGAGITLKDASGVTLSVAESGTLDVKPTRSTSFDLRATGLNGPLTASASVKVHPVIQSFTAEPPAAKQGEKITFAWKTAGAESVKLSEATFGEVVTITSQGSVDEGTFDFTVPSTFAADAGTLADGGFADAGTLRAVPDNFPLRFTLTAETVMPAQSVSASLQSFVRSGPHIDAFDVPPFVTEMKPARVSWSLTNAYRAELLLDGAPVFSTVPPATANGSFTLPSVTADVNVTLVAYDFNGLSVRQTKAMKTARAPKVNTFTLTPTVGQGGGNATAMWTTANATLLVLRIKNGPAEFESTTAANIAAGTTVLHPGRSTTYVLEAYNDAGDKDVLEKSVTVTTPLTVGATANPTAPSTLVQLRWDVGAANPIDVIGIPAEPPTTTTSSTNFIDIHGLVKANKLQFSQPNDATTGFSVGFGYTFPIAGQFVSTFSASTNGFVALGTSSYSTGTNVDLKGTSSLPTAQLIAPLWDDLDLQADGAVEWLLEGTQFPRRLIIQWSHVRFAGEPSSDLTFQVQLYESGEVRFEYDTLNASGTRASGDSATVGIYLGAAIFVGQLGLNAPVVSSGLQVAWFTGGSPSGLRLVPVGTQNIDPGFFYKTTQGAYVWVDIPVRVFNPNSVVVNEVMAVPAVGVTEGQYIELYNATGAPTDLGGLEISTTSAPTMTFVVPPNTTVDAGDYLVLGQTTVGANNGDAPVDIPYGNSLTLAGADTVSVKVVGSLLPDAGAGSPFTVNAYSWTSSTTGVSTQRDTALGGGIPVCARTQMYGGAGSTGTPGKPNESCFPYSLSTIPVDYEDVSVRPDATQVFAATWDLTNASATLAVPFKYFGVDAGSITISPNGWISTKSESSAADANKTAPGSGAPIGAIAAYWDDLCTNTVFGFASSNIYRARSSDHTTIQWKHASPYRSATADRTGDLNFEMKLFDTGVIEYHFADMINAANPTATGAMHDGTSATVWIEMPDGGGALPVSINQPLISPNSAYRFTPKP